MIKKICFKCKGSGEYYRPNLFKKERKVRDCNLCHGDKLLSYPHLSLTPSLRGI